MREEKRSKDDFEDDSSWQYARPIYRNTKMFEREALDLIETKNLSDLETLFDEFWCWGEGAKDAKFKVFGFVVKADFARKTQEEQKAALKGAIAKFEKANAEKEKNRRPDEGCVVLYQPKAIRTKNTEELQLGKAMSNTLSAFSYNYLKLKSKNDEGRIWFTRTETKKEGNEEREVTFEVKQLSDKSEIVLDFLFDKYAKRDDGALLKARPKETMFPEKFEEAAKKPEEYIGRTRSISFSSPEFRKQLGIRISDKEINQAVSELIDTKVSLEGVKIWCEPGNGGKRYRKITHMDRIAYSVTIEETGQLAPRTKDVQHKFIVTLGSGWALLFHNDVLHKRYACFPKEFYRTSKGARALGRYLSSWKESTLKIGQISEILGCEETKNLTRRKRGIEKKLDELKRIGIVKTWKRMKKNGREIAAQGTSWIIKMLNAKLVRV